jgi:hypothetical protein
LLARGKNFRRLLKESLSQREKSQGTDGKWDLSEFQKVCGRVAHNRLRRASLKI